MKPKQEQFNRMLFTLRKIAKEYMTSEQLRAKSEKMYGLEFEECIEMVYDNIQEDAKFAIKGIKPYPNEINQKELSNQEGN